MKRYFIVSDVHGFYDELVAALKEKGFNPNDPSHIFVSLGDLLDRGKKPMECLRFVNAIPDGRKILVRGNHEDMLDTAISNGYFQMHDFMNGTVDTVMTLAGTTKVRELKEYTAALLSMQYNRLYNEYKKCLVDYFELGSNVFVHGWIPDGEDWKNGDWEKARWVNGMEAWNSGHRIQGKTVYCGHWHTSYGHSVIDGNGSEFGNDAVFSPFVHEGIRALDACTAHSHKINVAIIEGE